MQYLIGFAIGCILTSFVMCKYAGKFAGVVMDRLTEEMDKVREKFMEDDK